tara:strand:- start:1169 stop:1309 length:141 start_codon:yes stop_codon:yes gene_type:complete
MFLSIIKTSELLSLLSNFAQLPEGSMYVVYPYRKYLSIKVQLIINA